MGGVDRWPRAEEKARRQPIDPHRQHIAMTLSLTPSQQEIREGVLKVCRRFDEEYWLARDTDGHFPHAFHKALADAGWLGIAMPETYGGSGLGITEAAVMMQAIAESGAAFSGASAV